MLGYEGTVEDITAVRQAQQALQHSERRFRALTEKAQVMTLVCDAAGVVLYVSPASRSLLGLEPAAVVGQCCFDWIHADDVQRCRDEFAEVVEARNPGVIALPSAPRRRQLARVGFAEHPLPGRPGRPGPGAELARRDRQRARRRRWR